MKHTTLLLCFCVAVIMGSAQDKTSVGISYQYALPMGAFKSDFISENSPRGISVDLMHAVGQRWRVGAALSYQDFYQKTPRGFYTLENGSTLSAVLTNSLQTTTLMAKGMYLPAAEGRLKPFLSAGVGVNMAQVNQTLGMFDNINDANFGLAAQAGAGVLYGLGSQQRTSLTAGVQYNYLPFNEHGIGGLNNLTFGAGVRFTLRQSNDRGRNDDDGWNRGRRQPRRYGW